MSKRTQFILLFLGLYAFRTLFGLSMDFFSDSDVERDALQVYLVGLKCFTTGTWPFFGPDQYLLTTGFHSQLPGALQGLVVALPLYILPIPEAPFLFLNLLSLSALAFLSWYIVQRLPKLPFPFVFAWISLLPWTLNQATHVYNPCYLLFGSTLFFIGFMEALPGISLKKIPAWAAYTLMGFGIFWNMQFHNSWVLLPPVLAAAFFWRRMKKSGSWFSEILGFLGGALIPFVCLLPTLLNVGPVHGSEGLRETLLWFNWDNFKNGFTILARYFSFPCFEMPRFIGGGSGERWSFLNSAPWLYPPYGFLLLLGWLQPFALLLYGWWKSAKFLKGRFFKQKAWSWLKAVLDFLFKWLKDPGNKDFKRVQLLFFASFLWVWSIFWFTTSGPSSHMYFAFLPLAVVYYFYVWNYMTGHQRAWRLFAVVCFIATLWFQGGFIARQLMHGRGIYSNRQVIVQAIQKKDYRILWERRSGSYY